MPTHNLKWNFLFSPLPIKFILPFLHMPLVPNYSIKPISRIPVVRRGGEQESEYLGGKTIPSTISSPTYFTFGKFPSGHKRLMITVTFISRVSPLLWNFSVCFSKISSALRTFIFFPSKTIHIPVGTNAGGG